MKRDGWCFSALAWAVALSVAPWRSENVCAVAFVLVVLRWRSVDLRLTRYLSNADGSERLGATGIRHEKPYLDWPESAGPVPIGYSGLPARPRRRSATCAA